MPAYRYYLDSPLTLDTSLVLEGEEWRHLRKVMRGQVGDIVEIVNGRGQLAEATIVEMGGKSAHLTACRITEEKPSGTRFILIQALPRPNRMDLIMEKGTELGMDEIWWFPADRSEKEQLSPTQEERLHHLAVAALKQCGRLHLPEIKLLPPLSQWPKLNGPLYYGDVSPEAPLLRTRLPSDPPPVIHFVIGPEAGLTPKEEELLKQTGGQGVRLHPHILRTDTAPLAALALLRHWLM